MKQFLLGVVKKPAFWKAVGIAMVAAGVSAQYADIAQLIGPELIDAFFD